MIVTTQEIDKKKVWEEETKKTGKTLLGVK
jgi:hypothetical protein